MKIRVLLTCITLCAACATIVRAEQPTSPEEASSQLTRAEAMRLLWQRLQAWEGEIAQEEQRLFEQPPEGSIAAVIRELATLRREEEALRKRLSELADRHRGQLGQHLEPLLRSWASNTLTTRERPTVAEQPASGGGAPAQGAGAQPTAAERLPDSGIPPEAEPAAPQPGQPVACGQPDLKALPVPDRPGLYQRVLAVPGARLHQEPDPQGPGEPLPLFAIRYVSAEWNGWLCVGPDPDDAGRGWLSAQQARPWKHMLVARFVEKGVRQRVLFFRDSEELLDLIEDMDRSLLAEEIYQKIEDGEPPDDLVAIEPEVAIDYAEFPYLLPIIEAVDAETDEGEIVRIVRVAAATRSPEAAQATSPMAPAPGEPGASHPLKVGIAFVVDTTSSMGPYINEIRRFFAHFQALARKSRYGDAVRFAVVGYRDNTAPDPRIGYVARVFLDFESAVSDSVLDRALAVEAARASTRNWREDAVAGLRTALEELAWEEVDARILVLVTDASARDAGDPLATTQYGIESIRALAQQRDVAIVVAHMRTPEAEKAGDVRRAERQYRRLATTGDRNLRKYIGLEGNTIEAFRVQLQRTAEKLMAALEHIDAPAEKTSGAPDAPEATRERSLSNLLLHEIFARSWLQVVGREAGTALPGFVEGWAADRDLIRPEYEALTVSVLLTRTELDDLAQRLARIVDAVRAGGTAREFWEKVWQLSGEKTTDPRAVRRIGQLLPSFLEDLPYRSKILSITREDWKMMKQTEKLGIINEIAEKITVYRSVVEDQSTWIRVDPDKRETDLFPLELRYLP